MPTSPRRSAGVPERTCRNARTMHRQSPASSSSPVSILRSSGSTSPRTPLACSTTRRRATSTPCACSSWLPDVGRPRRCGTRHCSALATATSSWRAPSAVRFGANSSAAQHAPTNRRVQLLRSVVTSTFWRCTSRAGRTTTRPAARHPRSTSARPSCSGSSSPSTMRRRRSSRPGWGFAARRSTTWRLRSRRAAARKRRVGISPTDAVPRSGWPCCGAWQRVSVTRAHLRRQWTPTARSLPKPRSIPMR